MCTILLRSKDYGEFHEMLRKKKPKKTPIFFKETENHQLTLFVLRQTDFTEAAFPS